MRAKRILSIVLAIVLAVSMLSMQAFAASDFTYTYPTEAMDVNSTTGTGTRYLTTLTQRAASEIPLIFGINVVGGNMFKGLQQVGGTSVNQNPDPYIWNYNYLINKLGLEEGKGAMSSVTADQLVNAELPVASYYAPLGNALTNPGGLYSSGGANQVYANVVDEMGGVGYAVGYRSDVIIGFDASIIDQIDLVHSLKSGDEFYQEGDEDYSPVIIDVQTGSVTSRMYSWAEMGSALSAYLKEHPELATRYEDPEVIGENVADFSAGIPYYIASLIANGTIEKKTAAYVSAIDMYTLTCVDPATVGNVAADVYAEVNNFNFVTGSYTVSELMNKGVDLIILGANGYGYSANATTTPGGSASSASGSSKRDVLAALADAGVKAEDMPLVMDSNTINVKIGENGYNYAPTTSLFVPYVQVYAYMDELKAVNPAINPVAMVQFMFEKFCHVEANSAADVALYYIGTNWDSVDEDYDTVPDLANYVYDSSAIISAIQDGAAYALSSAAAANGNTLLAAYRTADTAYTLLTKNAVSEKPTNGDEYITLTIGGETKYLDLTSLVATEGSDDDTTMDGSNGQYTTNRTQYQAIIDYYNSGSYGYGDDLQTTLQNYADHMVRHVWTPNTELEGTFVTGVKASTSTSTGFTDVPDTWYTAAVNYVNSKGIMTGTNTANTTFEPTGSVTRATLAQLLYNMEGKPSVTYSATFSDVADGQWYTNAIMWANANGIVEGSNGKFNPNTKADRQTVATMLYRYCEYKGIDVSATADLSSYSDASSISTWANTAMQWANASSIINGSDGKLMPTVTTDRAQMAQMMMNFCENLLK
jgi:hypothetical protein